MAAGDADGADAVRDVVGFARHADDGARFVGERLRSREGGQTRILRIHAFAAAPHAGKRQDFRAVAADDGGVQCEERLQLVVAPREHSGSDRIQHPGDAGGVRGFNRRHHGVKLMGGERPHVDEKS